MPANKFSNGLRTDISSRPPAVPPGSTSVAARPHYKSNYTDMGKAYVSDTYDIENKISTVNKPAADLILHQRQRSSGSASYPAKHSPALERRAESKQWQEKTPETSHIRSDSIEMSRFPNNVDVRATPISPLSGRSSVSQSAPSLNQLNNKWPHQQLATTPTTTTSGVGSGIDGLDADKFDDSLGSLRSTTPPLPPLSPSNTPPRTPPESPSAIQRSLNHRLSSQHSSWPVKEPTVSPINYVPPPEVMPSNGRRKQSKKQMGYTTGKLYDRRSVPVRPTHRGGNTKVSFRNQRTCEYDVL